jgi:class 3 adenylate cyclase/pimeloyl-ACP methyl ester carboxylesterase
MDPRVQYARTTDGVNIAFWRIGAGTAVIDMGQPPTHIEMEWRLAPIRAWYERFARYHEFVRFDTRGCGLSDRDIDEYSLETIVRDLESVVDNLKLGRFVLIGAINSSAAAIAYAARHVDRVDRLILWCPYAAGPEFFDVPGTPGLRKMVDEDWHMLTETASRSRFVWTADDHAREYAALWRAAVTRKVQGMLMDSLRTVDVTPLLRDVRAPTLVLQRIDRGEAVARRIADGVTDASLVLLPGGSAAPYLTDAGEVWATIAQFLGDPADDSAVVEISDTHGTAVILFADIVDSTRITERVGDAAFRERARTLDERLRAVIRAASGTPVEGKLLGDGVLAVFTSARQAIDGALRCAASGADLGLQLHLGVHAGDVIREGDNVYGGAVNIASRISGLSAPDEVLVSATVRDLARTSAGVTFEDRGEHALKGIDDPQRVFAVRTRTV